MTASAPMLNRMFTDHLLVSAGAGAGLTLLQMACADRLDDGTLALVLLSGIGDVASAEPSFALWDLGRMVAADPALTALFDEGMDDLSGRLAREPAAAGFHLAFARFLDDHGSRGPNEWEMACDVWGTRPDLPLAIVGAPIHGPLGLLLKVGGTRFSPRKDTIAATKLMGGLFLCHSRIPDIDVRPRFDVHG